MVAKKTRAELKASILERKKKIDAGRSNTKSTMSGTKAVKKAAKKTVKKVAKPQLTPEKEQALMNEVYELMAKYDHTSVAAMAEYCWHIEEKELADKKQRPTCLTTLDQIRQRESKTSLNN